MPPEDPDFPAAHSMDTEWFAVDDDGHVAVFDSGEGGAVPRGIEEGARDDLAERICFDHGDWLWSQAAMRGLHARASRDHEIIAFVRADRRDRLRPPRRAGRPFQDMDGLLVPASWWSWGEPSHQDLALLHSSDACAGCFAMNNDFWGRLGIFEYECPQDVSPYVRTGAPARPLDLVDLPPPLRDLLGRARIPGARFAEAAAIQPLEHLACATWQAEGFFDLDGTYHPLSEASTAVAEWPSLREPSLSAAGPWRKRHWWMFWK